MITIRQVFETEKRRNEELIRAKGGYLSYRDRVSLTYRLRAVITSKRSKNYGKGVVVERQYRYNKSYGVRECPREGYWWNRMFRVAESGISLTPTPRNNAEVWG